MRVDPRFLRPAEVDVLHGDASKANQRLGWAPEIGAEYRNWLGDLVPLADDPELWDEAVTTALDLLLEGED